jgi:glycosyltransferase involved in cell wall biosynthesis
MRGIHKIHALITCMWPLGGIRSYLRNTFTRFPSDEFDLTLIARSTHERKALEDDLRETPIRLVWVDEKSRLGSFSFQVAKVLSTQRVHLISSQGFLSSVQASIPNTFFRVPHILTVHGILERKYLDGSFAPLRRLALKSAMRNITVFHGVGNDILQTIRKDLEPLARKDAKWIVIRNGIDTTLFGTDKPGAREALRSKLDLDDACRIFGFFGRFMPEKGFDTVIRAVDQLKQEAGSNNFVVMAVGSEDYEFESKRLVDKAGLSGQFRFLPFCQDISQLMHGCDGVLMPSNWEAFPLVAAESICSGIPLIASTCVGLREVIRDTPTLTIPPGDTNALAKSIARVISEPEIKRNAEKFRAEAIKRFDINRSVDQMVQLFRAQARH